MTRTSRPLLERLAAAWRRSDAIFDLLAPGALHSRPIALRHPFIFYLGHLPAFGWNQVCRPLLGAANRRPDFLDLFERGIDPHDMEGGTVAEPAWPAVDEVVAWRDEVRAALREAFPVVAERPPDPGHVMARGGRAFHVVLEHELMHQETLLYMLAQLPHAQKRPPERRPAHSLVPGESRRDVRIPAGRAVLGADFDAQPFGWDNEFPQRCVDVPAFTIDSTPVTNGEFQEFVRAGGYAEPAHWTAEGWRWQRARGRASPDGWVERDGELFCRTLFDELPLRRAFDWPVSVAWVEASAYARWRGARLPTEAEFHRAAYGSPDGAPRRHPWGDAEPTPRHGNVDFQRWEPVPVGSCPLGVSAFGVHELVGNGWEWTSTVFAAHAGFSACMPDYPGYSADFFDGRHHVLLGGSFATDAELLRRSFRNWFQPHYPYVFSKFRCVRDG